MIDYADWIAKRVAGLRQSEVWRDSVTVTPPVEAGMGFVIDIDGEHVVAQFVVWTTGAMEATAGAVNDGEVFYTDATPIADEATLDQRWGQFCSEILRVEERDRVTSTPSTSR